MKNLAFPDRTQKRDGSWVQETVTAMRKASGDRRAAAKALGITLQTLASRISKIKGMAK